MLKIRTFFCHRFSAERPNFWHFRISTHSTLRRVRKPDSLYWYGKPGPLASFWAYVQPEISIMSILETDLFWFSAISIECFFDWTCSIKSSRSGYFLARKKTKIRTTMSTTVIDLKCYHEQFIKSNSKNNLPRKPASKLGLELTRLNQISLTRWKCQVFKPVSKFKKPKEVSKTSFWLVNRS